MAWLPDWAKRIKIEIDSGDIDSTLTDFNVMIYLSSSSGIDNDDVTAVFDELTSDANRKKIAITTNDGETQCYVEIEKWSDADEEAWLHVKVPSISSSSDTALYLYYDSSQSDNTSYIADSGSRSEAWESNFKGVYHLNELYGGTVTGSYKSPTANGDDYSEFSDPQKMYSSNDDRGKSTGTGQQHDFYDFDFGVASDVSGIEVSIEGNNNSSSIGLDVELSWDGGSSYTSSGYGATWPLSGTDSIETFGGEHNSWGRSWSQSEFSNANFRLRLTSTGSDNDFFIDHIQVRVYAAPAESFSSPSANGDDYTDWDDGQKVYSSDDDRGKTSTNGNQHDWYDFDFTVPNTSIKGIVVEVEGNNNSKDTGCDVELSWDGGTTYTSTGYGEIWPNSGTDSTESFGGVTDTWGRDWSRENFSNTNFRLRLTKTGTDGQDFHLDHIQVKIYYASPQLILDSTSNNYDGVGDNTPTRVDGEIGYCYDFAGDVTSAEGIALDEEDTWDGSPSGQTFTFRTRREGDGTYPSGVEPILAKGIGSDYGFGFGVVNSNKKLCMRTGGANSESNTTISNDTWYDVVAIVTSSNVNFYVDGSSSGTPSYTYDDDTTWDFCIGRGAANFFNGKIDEVTISTTERTAAWAKAWSERNKDHLLTFGTELTYEEWLASQGNIMFFGCNF